MALETLNKDSKVVVYNSDVDLADKGVRKNHQGAAVGVVAGHANIQDGANAVLTAAGPQKGDFIFYQNPGQADNKKFQLITKSFGKFDNSAIDNITLAGTVVQENSGSRNYVAATYDVTVKTVSTLKSLAVEVIIADANTITSIKSKVNNTEHVFAVGDVLSFPAGSVGSGSAAFTKPIVAADLAAQELSTAALA